MHPPLSATRALDPNPSMSSLWQPHNWDGNTQEMRKKREKARAHTHTDGDASRCEWHDNTSVEASAWQMLKMERKGRGWGGAGDRARLDVQASSRLLTDIHVACNV